MKILVVGNEIKGAGLFVNGEGAVFDVPDHLCGDVLLHPNYYTWDNGLVRKTDEETVSIENAVNCQIMWTRIKAERDSRKDGGFKVGDKWFHSDAASRLQQMGLVMAGAAVPAIQWKTMDGSFITMTPALAGQIFQAGFTLDTALFSRAEQHRVAMEASADPASYNYLTGWPERFEDGL